jgi:glycosyltransferase involved in cell wall biosynthesis
MNIALINQPQDFIDARDEQRGSVSIVQWELARRLAERHDVTVYAPLRTGQPRAESWRGIEIRRVPFVLRSLHKGAQLLQGMVLPAWPYFASRLYFREYFVQLARDLRAQPPDLIHLHSHFQFAPLLRRAVPDARIVLHMHQDELSRTAPHRVAPALAAVDAIVTVSHYVTKGIRARYPAVTDRVHTIGNGVDTRRFRPRESVETDRLPSRLLFVGRVSPDKGVHHLLDAFAILAAEDPELRLTIVGKSGFLPLDLLSSLMRDDAAFETLRDFYGRSLLSTFKNVVLGRRSSYVQTLLRRLRPDVARRVHLAGTVSLEELVELYRNADLLVLPSVWNESYGLPIAEAMASGLPVIASYCGGIPELVMDGVTGKLVPRCDVGALAAAMRTTLADRETLRRMGRAGRARAESVLTWDRSVAALERVYAALAPESRAQAAADVGVARRLTSSLSILVPSMSTTSMSKSRHASVSPVTGTRPSCHKTKPPNV